MNLPRALFPIVLLTTGSCAPADAPDSGWEAALADVVATERAFAGLASDSTVQIAFLSYLATDGILFRPGPVPARAALEANPMPADLHLAWEPGFADVSVDGDLGFTTGPWSSGRRSEPDSLVAWGQYVTLWRREGDGRRAVLDFGTTHPRPVQPVSLELAAPARRTGSATGGHLESLRIADEDLNLALPATSGEAWSSYTDAGIRWLRDGRFPAFGPESAPVGAPAGAAWTSHGADVASSGDLGYTWGDHEAGGATLGYYVRIWRRQGDGSWRIVLDAQTGPADS